MAQALSALPIGAKVKEVGTTYNGQPITFVVAGKNHYAANQVTLLTEKIISLKSFDGKEASNTDSNRKNYGNNRYSVSNLRQWLNSSAATWFAAQHTADAPPNSTNTSYNPYDTEKGFLANFSANLRNALQATNLTVAKNTAVDGGGSETVTDKVFLLSNTEVGLTNENSVAEGKLLALFSDNASRVAYPTVEAVANSTYTTTNLASSKPWYWWLRTPHASYSNYERNVYTDGSLNYVYAYYGHYGLRPAVNLSSEIRVSDTVDASGAYTIIWNASPVITATTGNDVTLYEGDTFTLDGNVTDTDADDVVTVKYSIDGLVTKVITAQVSNGTTPIVFNKLLTFKSGKLYDGANAITSDLASGVAHTLRIWAEDSAGNKSAEIVRTFYTVTNRAPVLSVDLPEVTGTVNADRFSVSGTCSDPDGNDVVVTYKVNSGMAIEVLRGTPGAFNFELALAELQTGDNVIVVEVVDTYNFKTSKTIKLRKDTVAAPVNKSVARYEITAPKGSANGVLIWVQRTESLKLTAEVSMTLSGEPESYQLVEPSNSAIVEPGIIEDEFMYTPDEAKNKIVFKLNFEKTKANDAITLITGVLL